MRYSGNRLAEHDGDVYCFGGFRYEPGLDIGPGRVQLDWFARSTNEIWAYSIFTRQWRPVATFPRPRSSHILGKIGARAYLMGGWDGTPWYQGDVFGRFHGTVKVFDFQLTAFIPNEIQFPEPLRRAFSATVSDGSLWMAGGLGVASPKNPEGQYLNEFTSFSPESGVWKTSSKGELPPIKKSLFSPGMCVLDDTFVLAGCADEQHRFNEEVFLWKPGMADWKTNSHHLPVKVTFPELIPMGGRNVLVIGGHKSDLPAGLWETITIDNF